MPVQAVALEYDKIKEPVNRSQRAIRWSMLLATDLPIILVGNLPALMPDLTAQPGTDRALYEALRRRDNDAYDRLYHDLFPSFRFWVTNNSGTVADAEDAFQRGLVNFLLNLESGRYQYQPTTKVTTVIFDYCKKVWLTDLRSSYRKRGTALPEELDMPDMANALQDMVQADVIDVVRQSLGQLKEGCRQLVQWFYVDELSLREIAERLTMKESSVKSKRYECTEQLKRIYQQLAGRRGV